MAPNSAEEDPATKEPSIESTLHPLFIHNNDHPGLILISQKLVGTDNYSSWKRSMQIALSAKNKMGIISGSYKEPDAKSTLRPHWDRANDMIISWIFNTVSVDISNSLRFLNTAASVWNELSERFTVIDGHHIFLLEHQIHQLCQQDTALEVYYHKLKGYWDELDALEVPHSCQCPCNCEIGRENEAKEQRKRLMQFLMGLHDSYTTVRGQILMTTPLPSAAKAYAILRQEEKQRQGYTNPILNPISMAANASTRPIYAANKKYQEPIRRSTYKQGVFCTHCHLEGHSRDACYKLVGYPQGHPLYNKQRFQKNNKNLPVTDVKSTYGAKALQVSSSDTM